jgi:alanine racemase
MADGTLKRLRAGMRGPVPPKATNDSDRDAEVTLAQGRSRPAWAEIDLAAVTHNAGVLAELVRPAQLCAVVKAHGYGHGGPAVAKAAMAGGAVGTAVALVDEGVELRQHDVRGPILLLSECGAEAVDTAMAYGMTPTVYTHEAIEQFSQAARNLGQRTSVHVKVDTGMHRVGAAPAEVPALVKAIADDPLLRYEGLWTHFPVADGSSDDDRAFTLGQLEVFELVKAELLALGLEATVFHAANTAGAIAFPSSRLDMVRCGIGLYGCLPGDTAGAFGAAASSALKPAMSLKARVVALRTLHAGERPSYGRLRPLPARAVVATVPIGYADGVPRQLFSEGYEVLIGGTRRPLAGMVTMDQIVVDCGGDATVQVGDEVVLLGRQGEDEISAEEWANLLGTISYEVLCGVGARVPRKLVNQTERGASFSPSATALPD